MKIKCEIKGFDRLDKKINKIVKEMPKRIEESIEDILKNIQGYAIKLERRSQSRRDINRNDRNINS